MLISKSKKDIRDKIIIFLLVLGFLVPLTGLLSMSLCNKPSVNECLIENRYVFSDFFYQYNIAKYIAYHGSYPYVIDIEKEGGVDGLTPDGMKRLVYHAPFYYYVNAGLYLIAKKIHVSDLFLIYFFSTLLIFFTNIIFFLILKSLSKDIYLRYNRTFVIYSLIIFLFLPIHLYVSTGLQEDVALYFLFFLAVFYYFKLLETKKLKYSILIGIIIGLSLLARIASMFIVGGFVLQIFISYLRKDKKIRNFLINSVIIGLCIGSYSFIRNFILYGNVLGDMLGDEVYNPNVLHGISFSTIFRGFVSYWGGLFGGNEYIKPVLGLFIIILCLLIVWSFISYSKKYSAKLSIFTLMVLSTLIICVPFTFDIGLSNFYSLITSGKWMGDAIQARYYSLFNPFIAIFSSLGLVKLKDLIKNKKFKILPDIFIIILGLLFIIDYFSAIFQEILA